MGEYADLKKNKVLALLHWINTLSGFDVDNGGKHQWIVKHKTWKRPFPICFKNSTINKVYIKQLAKTLTEMRVCTKEEFDSHL